MGKSIAKVVYKPDSNASDVFIVVVNHEEVRISASSKYFGQLCSYFVSILDGKMEVTILVLHYRLNH